MVGRSYALGEKNQMSNEKCQYCGRPLAGEICPAHGYVGNPLPVTPTNPATSGVPTGAEMMWPVATLPAGFLWEDGSSHLITEAPNLSALIRPTYGGADATHFYLPYVGEPSVNLIPAMASATDPYGWVTSSGDLSGYPNWKAFDHLNTGSGNSWVANAGETGQIGYQFVATHIITQYAITSRNEAGSGMTAAPKTWTLLGSTNASLWITLDTQTNITDWASTPNVRKVFSVANATAYNYYLLNITASNRVGYVGVGELEMMCHGHSVIKT